MGLGASTHAPLLRDFPTAAKIIRVMLTGRFSALALTLVTVIPLAACNEDVLDAESDLVVLNESPCDFTIYVDGREAFVVQAGSDMSLDDIGSGRHVVEALDVRGNLVSRRAIELASGEDYYCILDNC